MFKALAGYALAGVIGCAAPIIVLWLARVASADSNPALGALAVVVGLAVATALVAMLMPARWLSIAVISAAPLCLVALVMFAALAEASGGEYYWIWIGLAAGALAAAFGGAWLGARARPA
jgi:cell division protein FtsW (lipid II flippase)